MKYLRSHMLHGPGKSLVLPAHYGAVRELRREQRPASYCCPRPLLNISQKSTTDALVLGPKLAVLLQSHSCARRQCRPKRLGA
jgi:hypothetical protein